MHRHQGNVVRLGSNEARVMRSSVRADGGVWRADVLPGALLYNEVPAVAAGPQAIRGWRSHRKPQVRTNVLSAGS